MAKDNDFFALYSQGYSFKYLLDEYRAVHFFKQKIDDKAQESIQEHQKWFNIKFWRSFVRSSSTLIGYTVIFGYIVLFQGWETLTAGSAFLLLTYMDRIGAPLKDIASAYIGIENAFVGLKKFDEVKEKIAKSLPDENDFSVDVSDQGIVIYSDLVGWPNDGLALKKGTTLLIEGNSGAGKSTSLASVYCEMNSGLANDVERGVYFLSDAPVIFDGTVSENLSLGADDCRAETLWMNLWSDVMRRSGPAFDRNASSLSAGERQILAFVRAYSREPVCMIIDEGFSSIDRNWQEVILSKIAQNKHIISILVSHRPVSNQYYDETITLKKDTDGNVSVVA